MAEYTDNVEKLYRSLEKEGYNDIGTPEKFREFVSDSANVSQLHKALAKAGYNDIGTEQQFSDWLGSVKKQTPTPTTKPNEYPQPVDAAGNPITNNGQPYSQEVLAQYYSADNKGGNYRDLATIAGAMEQKQQAAPAPVTKQPVDATDKFGFTAQAPSPLQPAEEKPYKMPLMFKPDEALADNKYWANRQAEAQRRMVNPTSQRQGAYVFEGMKEAGEAETARLINRKAYDSKNFDTFFKQHVSPVFGEEKATAEQKVQEYAEKGKDRTGGLLARLAGKVRTDYAQEKFNDPQKVASTTLQRVQDDSSFGDYLLNRMGINRMETSGEDDSPQLSDREKEWMKKLFAKETQEVSDQITQRLYNDYQSQGAPSSVLDYIGGKAFNENLAAQLYKAIIQRAAGSSGLREQLRAMAYDEYGKDQSWLTRVAGGAAPFAVDALSGAFTLPNYIGQAVVKGGMKLAAQEVAKQMEKRAVARGLEGAAAKAAARGGEEIAQRYIATQAPILNIAMNTAGSAANFATYETQAEIARQIATGEFKPIDIMKEAVHGALLGSAMGATGGLIGRATRNASTLGKVGAEAASIGTETGIFALSAGLQKAMQDGVDIEDVDWADTAGEAFGTVVGMKSVGAVMHPKNFLNRYRKSKDYDLQLNQHDLDELKAAGYNFDDIFKGLGKFGEVTPMKGTTISKAKEYTPGPEGTATKKETTSEESWVDADTYEAIMRNPEISTSAKRKLVYIATGKILTPEPVFGVTMDTDSNGKPTIITLNAYGAPIETKDFKNEKDAEAAYQQIQDAARANTIGGLERIAEKAGHPEVVDEAKGRTKEETGIDVDNLDQMGDLSEEDASKVLDTYVKNLQESYMQRFNEDLQRIGEAAASNGGRTEIPQNRTEMPPSGTEKPVSGTNGAGGGTPMQRSERRDAAYQKGMGVSQDDTALYSIGHDNRVAEARMMQQMPDGSNTEAIRNNIMQAVDNGDIDAAEKILTDSTPYLNNTQIEAIENYLDAAHTQMGIDDAIAEQAADYEQRQREKLQSIADQQGNITELQMKDGTTVYLLAGDLTNHYGSIMVTDGNGNNQQRLVRDVTQVGQPRSVDEVLADNVNDFAAGVQHMYDGYANGSILHNGQQVDMIIAGQPVRAIMSGNDANGNPIFTMEDGSQITLTPQEAQESVMAADNAAIQQQLQQEAESARLAEQKQRFATGIKGYSNGRPDLSAPETDAQAAAEYLLSETMGDDKLRKQRLTYIDNTRQQLQQRSDEAKRELTQLNQWLAGNEDIASPEEVADAKAKIEQLNAAIADVDSRRVKWGEIRRNLMTPEERTEMEQQRRREIFNARTGYEPQVPQTAKRTNAEGITEEEGKPNFGLTSVANANNYLLKNFADAYQAEQFINDERIKLRNIQRDEIQPLVNERQTWLNNYTAGLTDMTPDEVKKIVHAIADLEAKQDQLSQQAVRLREIAEGIPALYERSGRNEELTPEEQRAKELDKANSREDKLRIARTLYIDYPEALSVINDQEPRELDEFIASELGLNSMNWEGFDQGNRHIIGLQEALFGKNGGTRGIGKGYSTNAFNMYLAPTGQGKGFDDVVHDIYESQPDMGDTKRWTTEDISNGLINLFLTAQKPSDISHRIIDNRIAEAEDIVRQAEEYDREMEEMAKLEEMQQWAEAYHLSPEEREEFEEFMKMPPTEPEQEIINNIIADEQDSRSNELDSQLANKPVGTEGEGSQGEVREPSTAAAPTGNTEQSRIEGAEASDGVEIVSGNNVSGGAQKRVADITAKMDKLQKKYRTLAPIKVVSIDSDEALQMIFAEPGGVLSPEDISDIRKMLKESKRTAVYDPDSKKIYIFAENVEDGNEEDPFFHENLHRGLAQRYADNNRDVADNYWEASTSEKSLANKAKIAEEYPEEEQKEEYLVHTLTRSMLSGKVDRLIDRLNPEDQEVINNILTNIGYDRKQEAAARQPEEKELEGNNRTGIQTPGDRGGVEDNSFSARLAKAIAETNTNPTEAQKEAGNYRKPELKFGGYTFRIENPKGSIRSGVDRDGREWSQEMHDTYGYIEEKTGKDGDKMDFFINDDADLDNFNGRVYVIDQKNEDGTFDEHKVMYGYPTLRAAREAYKRNYEDGWYDKHVMAIMGVKKADFDKWLADSDHKIKPFSEYFRTKILKDAIKDDVDQLMADVEERKAKEPEVVSQYTEEQLAKMDITTLSQLKKKAEKDAATSRVLLGTTNVEPGSDKEKLLKNNITQAEKDIEALTVAQDKLRAKMQKAIEDAEAGGAIVDHLQDMGIDVSTDPKENRKMKKKGDSDNSEEGKLRHMRTPDGKVYGFTYRGKMYLDPRMMEAERPLHEYGHLWGEAFRRINPEGWKSIVDVMKQDADTWNFVKQMNPDLTNDDDIAEEMIAKGTGEKGKQRVREEFDRMAQKDPSYKGKWNNIWKNISKAIQDFWKQVGDFLNIKYKSAEQVYDQVLKDFANGVNPRKKVEDWLKQRDAEYAEAVKSGNTKKATQIFNDALKENVGNGMTPFIAVDKYRKMQRLAHKIKDGDAAAIEQAADMMAPLIPKSAVLIPTPSRNGKATTMLQLANAIAQRTGSEVADILTGKERASQYDVKKQGGKALTADELGITVTGQIPDGKVPVVIDNVVDTGNTAEACIKALGTGIVASLADSSELGKRVASLRSAAPIIANRDGDVIPLSQRFDLSRKETGRPVDAVTSLMDEVDNRIDVAGQKEVDAAIESDEATAGARVRKSAENKRATKAVVEVVSDTGVPVKQVSREEADQMMQLFTMMNSQAIANFARSLRPDEHKRYAVINVRDPFGVPKYFEKREYAQEYKVWANSKGRKYEMIDLGYGEPAQSEELKQAADIMPEINVWHGSPAVFTKFDHSHIGEGAGSQVFGWGTYLTTSENIGESYAHSLTKGYQFNGKVLNDYKPVLNGSPNRTSTIRDILVMLNAGRDFDDTINLERDHIKSAIRDYEDEFDDLSEADKEDLKLYKEELEFVNSLKPEDFQKSPEMLYKVDIPDDTGDNYLDWMMNIKKPLRRKIAEAVRNLPGEPKQSFVYTNYKNGWQSLADMIEREQWAYKEIHDRLLMAFGGRIKDAEKVSKLMSSLGFVGVKYPAGTIWGNGDGATNYVIFNEDDAKITDRIQFMFDESQPEQDYQPVFYSNALKAVEGIKQEKATPEQWMKMIEKAGGLKAGEDKWLGLSEWLNMNKDKKSLTKQEVMDYIRQYHIQVADANYEILNIDANPRMQELRKEFDELIKKHMKEQDAITEESDAFNEEMFRKYGRGWANDPDRLSEEDSKRNDEFVKRYQNIANADLSELAFSDMVDKYGDDFAMGFEVDGNGRLIPIEDYYSDLGITDYAAVELGAHNPINSTRLRYTTEGLDNKKEIALVVPTIEPYNSGDMIHFGDAGGGRAVAWACFGDTEWHDPEIRKALDNASVKLYDYLDRMSEKYETNPDYPERLEDKLTPEEKAEHEQIMADIRKYDEADEAAKKQVLVIDEIQSKRHQDAREKGYSRDSRLLKLELQDRREKLQEKRSFAIERDLALRDSIAKSPEAKAMYDENGNIREDKLQDYFALFDNEELNKLYEERLNLSNQIQDIDRQLSEIDSESNGVPGAPFEKNWHELAMKRMLRYAAEHGYDKIAWTTGSQQAKRYALSKAVRSVRNSTSVMGPNWYTLVPQGGAQMRFHVGEDGKIDRVSAGGWGSILDHTIPELFGKDAAAKIEALKDNEVIDFENQEIGGEGMKGFYDDILPRFMNKYGKKWGVKVHEIDLPDLEKSAQKMWAIDVTPEMKESVMQGQPMFQKSRGGRVYGWTDGQGIFLTPDGMNPNTPMHEYTHLWDKYIQREDPKLWKEMVDTFKKTAAWQEVRQNPNYRSIWDDDDRMASEVHARLTGARTQEEFNKAAASADGKDTESIINQVKNVLRKFWEKIAQLFGRGTNRLEEFILMPLRDALAGINPIQGAEGYSAYPEAMIDQMAGEAKMVRMNRPNQYGLNEASPIGRKLTQMKKQYGNNALLGYIDNDFSGYVFLGNDARTISKIRPKYKLYDDNGMPAVYVNSKDFDSLSPLLISKGYMMGLIDPNDVELEPEPIEPEPEKPVVKSWSQGELFTDADFVQEEEPKQENQDLTQIKLRHLDEGEECHVERRYEEDKVFSFTGSEKIESLDDVAYIFRELQNAAVENTFAVLEKDGVPTIIHLAMGDFISSPAPFKNAFAAYSELKPDRVYFIHNHPSGNLKCSKQDQDLYRELLGVFGAKLQEGIIINTTSGKYGLFNSNLDFGSEEIPAEAKNETPLKVYRFSKQVFDKDWNPETAFSGANAFKVAQFVSSHRLGKHKKMSLIVLDQASHITGNIFLPWTKLSDAVSRENAQLIATYVTQMGGNNCVLYGNYSYNPDDELAVKDFQLMLKARRINLLDMVNMEGDSSYYRSYKEQGAMEPGAVGEGYVSEPVTDEAEIKRLESEPKETGYRNVVVNNDGTLGSPMASKLNKVGVESKPTSTFEIGKWERSDENPQLATDDGKINLVKPGNKRVSGVDYNPYIHIRPNKVNKQFKQAWERPNLVYVETEYPTSELKGDYQAEKAALPVGKHPWGGGELILSRWDKPMRIVPWEEVADDWEKEFKDRGVEFDIVPPALLPILAQRGVEILPPHKGMGKECQAAYEAFKNRPTISKDADKNEIISAISSNVTPQEVEQAMNSNLVKNWLSSGRGVDSKKQSVFNLFGPGRPMLRTMAKARLGINNKYHVSDGVFYNAVENLASFMEFAKKKGLDPKIADKYDWKDSDTIKNLLDSDKPIYTDKEVEAILKLLPGAKDDLQGMMQAFADENRIREEIDNLRNYDNGDAVTKAFAIYDIAVRRLREQYDKDERFYRPVTYIKRAGSDTFSTDTRYRPDYQPKEGEEVETRYQLRSDVSNEILSRIATAPVSSSSPKLENKEDAETKKIIDAVMRSSGKPLGQATKEKAESIQIIAEDTGDILGGVNVKCVTYTEANDLMKREFKKGTKGIFNPQTGEVTILVDNIADIDDAKRTVCHEKLGHEGLVALFGSQAEVNKFGHFVYKSASKELKQQIIDKADDIDPDWKDPLRFSKAAQEVLAGIAEDGPKTADEFSLWEKVKHYIIRFCNKLGLRIRGLLNDHDLAYYILKTGEALKTWNGMSAEDKAEAAKQGYDPLYSRGRGKPRKRNNESMAQYLQRLREWERWKIAEEQARANNDPIPTIDEINNKWEEKYHNDLAEWKQRNGITGETPEIGEFPKRRNGETPQEYAARVADYETQVDIYKEAPSLFDYLQQANEEYRAAYKAWRERYGIAEAENVDLGLYEGDPDRLPHIVDPEDLEAENRADAELAEAVGIDMSSEGAQRHTKLAVIERRKNLESANAEDAIWIHNMVKRIDEEAKRQGVEPKELRSKLADIIEGTYFEDVIKDEHGNVISIEDISDRLPIKLTPELQDILSDIKDWYDYFYHQLEDAGLRNDAGYIEEGYVNHVWSKEKSNPQAWEKYIENFQRTKSPNMRERIFDTYRAGEDVGLVRKFNDIGDILAYYSSSNNQAIANRKFLDDLSFVVVEELNSDGEVVSVLPLLNSSKPSAMTSDRYDVYKVPGVGDVWVIKDIQRTFSNIFGTMRTKDIAEWATKLGKAYDTVSSTAKKIQLAFSAFHMGALTEVAMAQMRPDKALRALGQYIIFDCAKAGTIPAYAHPEDFKLAAGHLVQLGATQDYSAADVNNVTEKLREIVRNLANEENLAKKGAGYAATPLAAALDYINKGMDKVLWNYLHDGLKIACFKMFAQQIEERVVKEGLTPEKREELLDEAGQYVNDTFGGQYWELLNVSPSMVKWMRRAFLSPDWLISTQRHFLANFGFGSLYSESGFMNYLQYNADNIKRVFGVNVPRNENRRFRSSNAKKCYLLGVLGFFYIMMNALNAVFRAQDEKKDKEMADEMRKTNPDYKSPYELAYPDGMKWYDYTMYGNTIGQQTHLFLGRYDDGTEWYARWGKQFREFPELFMGRHGVEFPTPLMERMSGKANPVGRYLMYDLPLTVGMYGYKQPRETQEIADKYGNTVALLAMTAKKFLPFSVPTQKDKEFKMFDLVMPSQKGFTQWKAVDFFKTYIEAGDMDGVMRTYNAAAMNNLDAEAALKAAIATIKATQRKELADGVIDLQTAMDRFDAANSTQERKLMKNKIIKYLAEQNYKAFTRDEAREQVETFLSGDQLTDDEANKYVDLQTSSDVRDDYRLSLIKKQAKKFVDEVKTAEGQRQEQLARSYQPWIKIHGIIKKGDSATNKLKKQLGKGKNDAELMRQIRDIRANVQKQVDEVQAP